MSSYYLGMVTHGKVVRVNPALGRERYLGVMESGETFTQYSLDGFQTAYKIMSVLAGRLDQKPPALYYSKYFTRLKK